MRAVVAATILLGALPIPRAGTRGYLPAIGPAPLRFQEPPASAPFSLPPLPTGGLEPNTTEPATAATETHAADATPATELPTQPAARDSGPPVAPTNEVKVLAAPAPPAPAVTEPGAGSASMLSAQMLVPFFTVQKGTNRLETVVIPPETGATRPSSPPSSTSTYLLSPPRTP